MTPIVANIQKQIECGSYRLHDDATVLDLVADRIIDRELLEAELDNTPPAWAQQEGGE